jgi:hypothetical protein
VPQENVNEVRKLTEDMARMQKMVEDTMESFLRLQAGQNAQDVRLNSIERQMAERNGRMIQKIGEAGYCAGKIILKIGGKEFFFQSAKVFSSEAAKKASKVAAKATPFLGLGIAVGACGYRVWQGQYLKASGELTSGVASLFPGPGTILSMVIDLLMGVHDVYEFTQILGANVISVDPNLQEAFRMLSIENKEDLTKEEVDHAYRIATRIYHSDHMDKEGNEDAIKRQDAMTALLSDSRDVIYKEKGW